MKKNIIAVSYLKGVTIMSKEPEKSP